MNELNYILNYFKSNLLVSSPDIFAFCALYFLCFKRRWREMGKRVFVLNTLLYFYNVVVFFFTLMPIITALPRIFDHPYTMMHMIPFDDLSLGRGGAVVQLILNMALTIPFGFLISARIDEKRFAFLKTVGCTVCLSLFIELLQPLLDGFRSSDITDVIINTVGGALGFPIYKSIKALYRNYATRIEKNNESQR